MLLKEIKVGQRFRLNCKTYKRIQRPRVGGLRSGYYWVISEKGRISVRHTNLEVGPVMTREELLKIIWADVVTVEDLLEYIADSDITRLVGTLTIRKTL